MNINEMNISASLLNSIKKYISEHYDKEIEVEYDKSISRWTGTGYKNEYYKMSGTDDALIIKRNDGQNSSGFFDNFEIDTNYYLRQREYGRACSKLSKKYNLPWKICSILGTDEKIYPEFTERIKTLYLKDVNDYEAYENLAGIGRRNQEIKNLFPEEMFDHLSSQGQKNSRDMFDFLFEKIFENEEKLKGQLKQTESYTKLITDYKFSESAAIEVLYDLQFSNNFLSQDNDEQLSLISQYINELSEDTLYTKPQINIFLNKLAEQLESGKVISTKFLIDKLNELCDYIGISSAYLKTALITNAVKANDINAVKNLYSIDTYKEKIMPSAIAENLINVIKEELNAGKKINLSELSYNEIMKICVPIHRSNLTNEQKTQLQTAALKMLLTDKKELSKVILVEGGIDDHSVVRNKSDLLAQIITDFDDVSAIFDKIMEFMNMKFDNTKAYCMPSEYAGDITFSSEMETYVNKTFYNIEYQENSGKAEVDYCVKNLRSGDVMTVFTNGTAIFGTAIEPEKNITQEQLQEQVK